MDTCLFARGRGRHVWNSALAAQAPPGGSCPHRALLEFEVEQNNHFRSPEISREGIRRVTSIGEAHLIMRIGFDVSQTGLSKAGCGFYAEGLVRGLGACDGDNEHLLYPTFGDYFYD